MIEVWVVVVPWVVSFHHHWQMIGAPIDNVHSPSQYIASVVLWCLLITYTSVLK
jgi:hypothetical protein